MKLKPIFIEARDLPDGWFQCVYQILEHGREFPIDKGSYAGQKRLEFDYITVHVTHPGVRPLTPDIPPALGIPDPVAPGYVEEYLPYLMTDKKEPTEDYTYGERLTSPKVRLYQKKGSELIWQKEDKTTLKEILIGPNQIEEVIRIYKEYGYRNNQMILQIGMPSDILLGDPPCLRQIDTRIQDNKLHFFVYFRSWDLWNGFPANLAAVQILKEYMASGIGVEDGEMIVASKGLHLYDYIWELAKLRTMKSQT